MPTLIQRTRTLQNNLFYNHRFKKQLQQRAYKVFLQQRTGYLPSLRTLEKWRKHMLMASFLCLCPMCLGTIIDWQWVESDLIPLPLPILGLFSPVVLCGAGFIIFLSFAVMFDRVIYKRGGKQTFIHW